MRRTLILFGIAVVVVIAVGVGLFFTSSNQGAPQESGSGGLFGSLFPFNFGGATQTPGGVVETPEPVLDTSPVPTLRKVSANPTVGGVFFEKEGGSVALRYIDRATGHIFEAETENRTVKRISNTTIPEIQEALWADEKTFVIRYLEEMETIETFFVELASTSEEQALNGNFVSSWNRGVLNPQKTTVFSATEKEYDAELALSNLDGSNRRVLLNSTIRSWIPLQSREGQYVYSAPFSGTPGFLYRLAGGNLVPVVRNIPGLLAQVSPDGGYTVFSSGEGNTVALYAQNNETGVVYESPVQTLASKCAVLPELPIRAVCGIPDEFPQGAFPNDWLLGKVGLSDSLWLVDFESGAASLLSFPEDDVAETIDVLNPFVDASGSYAGFLNKNDLSFWVLRLTEEVPTTSAEVAP